MYLVFALVLTVAVNLSEEIQVIGYLRNGDLISFDVSVNENYATAVSGQPFPPQPFFRQTINIYDFKKKLEARKVIEDGVCYIKDFAGTREQFTKMLDDTKMSVSRLTGHISEDWNSQGVELKGDHLVRTLGPLISSFCSDYKIYSIVKRKEAHRSGSRRTKRQTTYDGSVNVRENTVLKLLRLLRRHDTDGRLDRLLTEDTILTRLRHFLRTDTDAAWLYSWIQENFGHDSSEEGPNGWYSRETVDRDEDASPTGFGSGTVGYRSDNVRGRLSTGNSRDRGQIVGASLEYRSEGLNSTGQAGLAERGELQSRNRLNLENERSQVDTAVDYDDNIRFCGSAGFSFDSDW